MKHWPYLAAIIVLLGLTGGGLMLMKARGLRNNNPGNIKRSKTQWVGLKPTQSDNVFLEFTDPVYGIRALYKILMTYKGRGLNTIEKVISTWAPSNENDTRAYIETVAKRLAIDPRLPLQSYHYVPLIKAIIHHENGTQPYSNELIEKGISLA